MALTDSLISFWALEEASGTRDDSVGTNNLTDNNTVTQDTGKVGFAAEFLIANSESLSVADNASISTGDIDFTLAGWVWLDAKAAVMNIWGQYDTTAQRSHLLRYSNVSDRLEFVASADGTAVTNRMADSFGSPSTAEFHFVIVWHDATLNTINIQVNNGTVDTASHAGGTLDSTSTFRLGAVSASGTPAGFFSGRIDQLGFWKRLLTAAERDFLFNGGAGQSFAAIQAGLPTGKNLFTLLGVGK